MKTINLSDDEVKQLLFELRSSLEVVNENIENFIGEDEIILGIIAKLMV